MAKTNESIKVTVSSSFPAEKALRVFKRLCDSYGIVKEYRKRKAYDKPSKQKKEKSENAEKRKHKTKRLERRGKI